MRTRFINILKFGSWPNIFQIHLRKELVLTQNFQAQRYFHFNDQFYDRRKNQSSFIISVAKHQSQLTLNKTRFDKNSNAFGFFGFVFVKINQENFVQFKHKCPFTNEILVFPAMLSNFRRGCLYSLSVFCNLLKSETLLNFDKLAFGLQRIKAVINKSNQSIIISYFKRNPIPVIQFLKTLKQVKAILREIETKLGGFNSDIIQEKNMSLTKDLLDKLEQKLIAQQHVLDKMLPEIEKERKSALKKCVDLVLECGFSSFMQLDISKYLNLGIYAYEFWSVTKRSQVLFPLEPSEIDFLLKIYEYMSIAALAVNATNIILFAIARFMNRSLFQDIQNNLKQVNNLKSKFIIYL